MLFRSQWLSIFLIYVYLVGILDKMETWQLVWDKRLRYESKRWKKKWITTIITIMIFSWQQHNLFWNIFSAQQHFFVFIKMMERWGRIELWWGGGRGGTKKTRWEWKGGGGAGTISFWTTLTLFLTVRYSVERNTLQAT